ncbi:MAG: BREX-1 system adenine-specific DNA-methyltransferase PglX [Planctomycetia bacterium]|nr:BREX-1 system adenine-specific DNA-methyltransferase PglX [Planctomycetia bacterium]
MNRAEQKNFAQRARRMLISAIKNSVKTEIPFSSGALHHSNFSLGKEIFLEQTPSETGNDTFSHPVKMSENSSFQNSNENFMTDSVKISQRETHANITKNIFAGQKEDLLEESAEKIAYAIFYRICALCFMKTHRYITEHELNIPPLSREDFCIAADKLSQMIPSAFPFFSTEERKFIPEDSAIFEELWNGVSAIFNDETVNIRTLGWLYQYFFSEKKDAVFAMMKRGMKLSTLHIPTVTQVFTPEWISEFLVANTLLIPGKWRIPPDEKHTSEFQKSSPGQNFEEDSPDILLQTFCDPACGCGHILLSAYDAFFNAYLAAGTPLHEIPRKILTQNLFGMEIDSRVAQVTIFLLLMKARQHDATILNHFHPPHIRVIQSYSPPASVTETFLNSLRLSSCKIREKALLHDLSLFHNAATFGTLLRPELSFQEVEELLNISDLPEIIHQILIQLTYLTRQYNVVVTNPPYMGSRGMNSSLASWLNTHYPEAKNDLFSAFILRNMEMTCPRGQLGFMTPFVWMFISSYKKLRLKILNEKTLTSLIQLEYSSFQSATVPICVFTLQNTFIPHYKGAYIRLSDFRGAENQAPRVLHAIQNPDCGWFYRVDPSDFHFIPEAPLAYWLTPDEFSIFSHATRLEKIATPRQGCATSDNKRFLRFWYEVDFSEIAFHIPSLQAAKESSKRWFPYNKGGAFRKWSGNQEYIIHWENDGSAIKEEVARRYPYLNGNVDYVVKNREYYFQESLSWSKITSGDFALRYYPPGFAFDVSGCSLFCKPGYEKYQKILLGCMNSPVMTRILSTLAPTLNYEVGQIAKFPLVENFIEKTYPSEPLINEMIQISDDDWNTAETSWNFMTHPAFLPEFRTELLSETFSRVLNFWKQKTQRMKLLEERTNQIFLQAYNLTETLSPEISLREVTLRFNPFYRYQEENPEQNPSMTEQKLQDLQMRLTTDGAKEFISYAVGCLFGRFSPDSPGIILAGKKTLQDFKNLIPQPSISPVSDNILIITKEQNMPFFQQNHLEILFQKFLETTFGKNHLDENLTFLQQALGKKLSRYFHVHFYKDHVKFYHKRPIYWLFSSPQRTFQALVYLHRYHSDIPHLLIKKYLQPLLSFKKKEMESLSESRKSHHLRIHRLRRQITELETYMDHVLWPLANAKIELSLDDGILINYAKMGAAVSKIS